MSRRTLTKPLAVLVAALVLLSGGAVTAQATPGEGVERASAATATLRKPQSVRWSVLPGGAVRVGWSYDDPAASFRVHLGLEQIGSRGTLVIPVAAGQHAVVLDSSTLRKLRAPIGSGRHFNVRVEARNGVQFSGLTKNTWVMAGQRVTERPARASRVRVAAFNLGFTPDLSTTRLASRRIAVAKPIAASGASVVAVQESVVLSGDDTRLRALRTQIRLAQQRTGVAASWRWVRSTRYVAPGSHHGGDGTRILYDAKRLRLLSNCPEFSGSRKLAYSASCAIKLPRVGGVREQRWAAIARFQDRGTGQKFWVVSVHLEPRKGRIYDANRRAQRDRILTRLERVNRAGEPVIIAGDFNLSGQRSSDLTTLNGVVARGYVDAVTAERAHNLEYRTYNGWERPRRTGGSGYAARIDMIYGGGTVHFSDYTTVLSRASDHHLIRATAWID